MKRTPFALVSVAALCAMGLPALPAVADDVPTHDTERSETRSHDDVDEAFRVLPYLQKPAQDQMTIVWFTETDEPGTLVLSRPGKRGGSQRFTSEPEHQPLLDYTDVELAEEI